MKLLITGGSLIAEFQHNPLDSIKKQLASISQKSELDISNLRSHIDRVSELKDGRIDKLIEEFQERSRLEDLEIEELKALVVSITRDNESEVGRLDMDSLRDQLQANSSKTKDIVNKINEKIDRITKDNAERVKRFQEKIIEIGSENKKKIATIKDELFQVTQIREKERKQEAITKAREYLPEHKVMKKAGVLDGRKFMGKLNYKPKLPI